MTNRPKIFLKKKSMEVIKYVTVLYSPRAIFFVFLPTSRRLYTLCILSTINNSQNVDFVVQVICYLYQLNLHIT